MNLKSTVFSLVLFGLLTSNAWAKKSYKKVYYGMAGCGLGASFIDKNEQLPQIGAWFVNGISSNQTSAITSGTSHCSDRTPASEARMEQEVFVSSNLAALSKEAARGKGEHLEALAEVLGCSETDLSKLCQERYHSVFLSQDGKATLDNLLREIKLVPALSKGCERVI